MATEKRNRFVSTYHSLVAILVLLAGAAALGFGIWLQVTGNGGVFQLEYDGDSFLNFILRIPVSFMIVGGFLLLTGVVSLIAMGRQCVGVTFRIVYILLAAVIAAVLVLVCVLSILIRVNGGNEDVQTFLSDAWNTTAQQDPGHLCEIESHFQCRGFNNNDCDRCSEGTEPACDSLPACVKCSNSVHPSFGCYNKIIGDLTQFSLPSAIVSGILAAVVIFDIFISCCL